MANVVQHLRSPNPGARPTGRAPGELFINTADGILGYIDDAGQPVDLPPPTPPYVLPIATDTVLGGVMVDGTTITAAADGTITGAPDLTTALDDYVLKTGDVMTGPLTISESNAANSIANPQLTLDCPAGGASWIAGSQAGLKQWSLTLASVSGNLTFERYDAAGAYVNTPLTLLSNGNAEINAEVLLRGETAAQGALISSTIGPVGAGNSFARWSIYMANTGAETGGNSGSNFEIDNHADDGALIGAVMIASRSTAVCTFTQPIVDTSDRRVKSNIEPVTDALAIVEQLQGVYFNKEGALRRQVGLIAQDVAPTLPEVVFETPPAKDAPASKDEPMLGVAYGSIVAVLIEAIKELSAKVTALEGGAPARNVTVNTVKVQPRARPPRKL